MVQFEGFRSQEFDLLCLPLHHVDKRDGPLPLLARMGALARAR
jgi:hypothetical protein